MRSHPYSIGLLGVHCFAWLTLAGTLLLICSGGLVTSKGVGMAVPDWPTTYGYNMFLFPVSRWVGGIFYEHTHRLIASGVGLLTMILAIWLLVVEHRRWMKILGAVAFVGVVIQGLLGGLRVTLFKDEIGIFHGVLAQLFLCTIAAIVLFTSKPFLSGRLFGGSQPGALRWFGLWIVTAIFVQLAVGAAMRHAHSGLSIRDFPLAYGQVWPPTDAATLARVNEQRVAEGVPPTTAGQIHLQMLHRILAFGILGAVAAFAWKARAIKDRFLKASAGVWLALIVGQVMLGAWTIWSDKAADIATTHVFVGALCLLVGTTLLLRQFSAVRLSGPSGDRSVPTASANREAVVS